MAFAMREQNGWRCFSAFAVTSLLLGTPLVSHSASPLTLAEAFQRASQAHPDLARFAHLRDASGAEADQAAQRPAIDAGAELENILGTGDASGVDGAELTLSIASVLERGGKRTARTALAQTRGDALDLRREARRLDLLADVARRYLDVLAVQALERIAEADIAQRERTVRAASRRVGVGAAPMSARLAAEAALSRARLQLVRVQGQWRIVARRLAILWGERSSNFERVVGDPLTLPSVPSLESLLALLDRSPELRRFADETRLREARLQLARAERSLDLKWQIGVRRLEATNGWAAVAGVSLPIGSGARAEPAIRAAHAELAALELEREGEEIALYATLVDAYGRLRAAETEVSLGRDEVLPRLVQAESAAERAYKAGASSYLEWAQLQADITLAHREQLQSALEAHRALIEIQRLAGEPFLSVAPNASREIEP